MASDSQTADFHNFGQSVQKIERGGESFFQKPRPIFWEWLFFGRNSPLSDFFDGSGHFGIDARGVLFNLETEIDADLTGRSREVVAVPDAEVTEAHAYSLGVLLAYCYIFGIRDLHRQNVVKTKTHLQVVDAEVVLARLLLPHETLLLPFKEVGPDLCGASLAFDIREGLGPEALRPIFSGYVDTFTAVTKYRSGILDVFASLEDKLQRIPIRHILRDTVHYRAWQAKAPEIPFFPSEVTQLQRGDVPYYFKFLGQSEVFEFTNPDGAHEAVALPDIFLKGAAREAIPPELLLDETRLRTSLLPTGLLYMVKILAAKRSVSVIEGSGFKIHLTDSEIIADLADGKFSAPRA